MYIFVIVPSLFVLLVLFMFFRGKIYINKIGHCHPETKRFCGLRVMGLPLPYSMRETLLRLSRSDLPKRVNIGSFKSGRTISNKDLQKHAPSVVQWYMTTARSYVSEVVGSPVQITPLDVPTSVCLLVYDQPGDHIDWHFDVNYYTGRFFTVLVPVSLDRSNCHYVYKNSKTQDTTVHIPPDKALLFEGDLIFHKTTRLGPGETRVVLSMQFCTDPSISLHNRVLRRLKDSAYIGI